MTRYKGTFSDGKSATAVPVWVWLGDRQLQVQPQAPGTHVPQAWPYDALVSSGPLLKGESPLLGHRDHPGWRLYIEDAAATEALLHRVPRLSPHAARRRVLWPMLAAMALLLAGMLWLVRSDFSVARILADALPRSLHVALGRALVGQMTEGRVCARPDGMAALRTMTLKLAGGRKEMCQYQVMVGRLGMINAFTTPGGYVVLSEDLIRFARSPDEVAGVLAHEMGHADYRHPEAALVRSAGLSFIGALMFGDTGIGNLAVLLMQLGFSRQAERQADAVSVRRMQAAGADPATLASFFRRLQQEQGNAAELGVLAMFNTHPPTPERIAFLQKAAVKHARAILDRDEWQALRNICSVTRALDEVLDR